MNTQHLLCPDCRARLINTLRARQAPAFTKISRSIRDRAVRIKQAIQASAVFGSELRIVSAASLLAGGAAVFMIYVIASIFSF